MRIMFPCEPNVFRHSEAICLALWQGETSIYRNRHQEKTSIYSDRRQEETSIYFDHHSVVQARNRPYRLENMRCAVVVIVT